MVNAGFDSNTPLDDARQSIEQVIASYPSLNPNGFCVFDLASRGQPDFNAGGYQNELLTDDACRQFNLAVAWLDQCTRTKTINRRQSSYDLKDEVEDWTTPRSYVSNGAFIAAAIHLGYKTILTDGYPNAHLNISKKERPALRP
jgi:hypothetical protein